MVVTQIDLAPENYEAMHRQWYPYIVNLVGRSGIHPNNREDVASEIFLRVMEWDIIGEFNPEIVVIRNDAVYPARFRNFLSSVVMTYVRGHRERQVRLRRRELQMVHGDITDYDERRDSDSALLSQWMPAEPDPADAIIDIVMENQMAVQIRDKLAKVPKRSGHDTCDLPQLFDAVREQVNRTGMYDVVELTEMFGVGVSTMYVWIRWLRTNLADIYGFARPTGRPRRTGPRATP